MQTNDVTLLISNNDIKEALKVLKEKIQNDSELVNSIILLEGRYQDLKNKNNSGTLDDSNNRIERNNISQAILVINTEYEEKIKEKKDKFKNLKLPVIATIGLNAWSKKDGKLYGRDKEIEEYEKHTNGKKFSIVTGISGVGKSSFISAGFIEKIKWKAVIVSASPTDPFGRLFTSIKESGYDFVRGLTEQDIYNGSDSTLLNKIKKFIEKEVSDSQNFILFIDQFEILSSKGSDPKKIEQFINFLVEFQKLEKTLLIIAINSISLELLSSPTFSILFKCDYGLFSLQVPTDKALEQIILTSFKAEGFDFNPALYARILNDISVFDEKVSYLPLLTLVLTNMGEKWIKKVEKSNIFDIDLYNESGDLGDSIKKNIEDAIDYLNEEDRKKILPKFFNSFVGINELGKPTRKQVEYLDDEIEQICNKLNDFHLLTRHDKYTVLAHDIILQKWGDLEYWFDENKSSLDAKQVLEKRAKKWEKEGKPDAFSFLVNEWKSYKNIEPNVEEGTIEQTYLHFLKRKTFREVIANANIGDILTLLGKEKVKIKEKLSEKTIQCLYFALFPSEITVDDVIHIPNESVFKDEENVVKKFYNVKKDSLSNIDKIKIINYAIINNQLNLVETLKEVGYDILGINEDLKDMWSPFHNAVYVDDRSIIEYLIDTAKNNESFSLKDTMNQDAGTQNILSKLLNKRTSNGLTPLMVAVYYDKIDITKYLLNYPEIDIHAKIYGRNALHIAAQEQRLEILKYLIDNNKIDANVLGAERETLLHILAENKVHDKEILHYLVEEVKMELLAKNEKDEFPIHISLKKKNNRFSKYCIGRILDLEEENKTAILSIYETAKNAEDDLVIEAIKNKYPDIDLAERNIAEIQEKDYNDSIQFFFERILSSVKKRLYKKDIKKWHIPPLLPFNRINWEMMPPKSIIQTLRKLDEEIFIKQKDNIALIDNMRNCSLSFYPNAKLYEARVRAKDGHILGYFTFIIHEKMQFVIDGESKNIHNYNSEIGVKIDSLQSAEDYLLFFTRSLSFESEAKFYTLDSIDDILWLNDEIKEIPNIKKMKLIHTREETYELFFEANMQYNKGITNVIIKLNSKSGEVSMTDDSEIIENLVVYTPKFKNGLRYIEM